MSTTRRAATALVLLAASVGGCITDRVLTVDDSGVVIVDDAVVDRARTSTEQRRGLPFVRTVPLEVLSSAALATWLNRYYDPAKASLQRRDRFFHKLGILPPTRDTASTYRGFVGNFAGGIYDDDRVGSDGKKGTMILVHDYAWWSKVQLDIFGAFTGVDYAYEMFLVHELTHALQDQHLHLDRLFDGAGDDDVRTVRKTILESEASVIGMAHFAGFDLRHVVPRTLFFVFLHYNNALNAPAVAAVSGRSSSFFARQTFSQYELGLGFVEERLTAGEWLGDDSGGALAELSRAYVRVPGTDGALPESTEQLLFPAKRGAHRDRPVRLAALVLDDLVTADEANAESDAERPRRWRGHTVLASGTFGALALKHWLEGDRQLGFGADAVVDGWGGDRYELLIDDDDSTALVWRFVADSDKDAGEFFVAVRDRLRAAYATAADPHRVQTAVDDDHRFVAVVAPAPNEQRAIRTTRLEHLAIVRRGAAVVVVNGIAATRPLDDILEVLFTQAVAAPADADTDRRRAAVAADLEKTLSQTIAAQAPTSSPLADQLLLPAHSIVLRAGLDVSRTSFIDDDDAFFAKLTPGFSGEARWGVRSFLELSLPFAATLHAPSGPFHAAIGVAAHRLAINDVVDGPWSGTGLATILWTADDIGVAAQLAATPTLRLSALSSRVVSTSARLGAVLRPMTWLILQPGLEVEDAGVAADAVNAQSEVVLRIGGVLQRGFVDAPLVELEVLSGLKLWASTSLTWRLAEAGTTAMRLEALIEQRAALGLLILF